MSLNLSVITITIFVYALRYLKLTYVQYYHKHAKAFEENNINKYTENFRNYQNKTVLLYYKYSSNIHILNIRIINILLLIKNSTVLVLLVNYNWREVENVNYLH